MAGYWQATQAYLRELHENNSKAWFDAHRADYEAHWRAPALAFIDALAGDMAALDPPLKAEARLNGSLRRINRDVRFSKDKSPYAAKLHLIFWAGAHPNRSPAMHLVIHPDGYGFGAGQFGLEPSQLKAMRERICNPHDRRALQEAIATAQSVGCDFGEPDLKTLPKGFEADEAWEHLLRRKAMVLRTQSNVSGPDWATLTEATQGFMALTRACMPLVRWLQP